MNDQDMEALNHMVRRDSATDAEIADWAAKRLKKSIAPSLHAAEAAVSRYRASRHYRDWLSRWEQRDVQLKADVAAQRERYALVRELVSGREAGEGLDAVSLSLQARLLTLATEATDEDLKVFASGRGWITNTLSLTRDAVRDQYRKQLAGLKAEIEKMGKRGKGDVDYAKVVQKVDELMGLKA